MKINIRNIQLADNPFLSKIIKDTLAEFGANRPGTVYYDPTTDALFELFQTHGAAYFVAELKVIWSIVAFPTVNLGAMTVLPTS